MVAHPRDASAAAANELRTDDVGLVPITALDEHVRLDRMDELEGCVLVEERHVVDHLERGQHLRALVLGEDRAAGCFSQAADRTVAVYADDQEVTEASRLAQRAHVPRMKQVEATVREDDGASRPPFSGERLPQLGTTHHAAHVASVASRASGGELFWTRSGC